MLGGFSPHAARRLRRHGRAAALLGQDSTDYTRSYTARSFVPPALRTQRKIAHLISPIGLMHGAAGIIHCLGQLRTERLGARAAPGAALREMPALAHNRNWGVCAGVARGGGWVCGCGPESVCVTGPSG